MVNHPVHGAGYELYSKLRVLADIDPDPTFHFDADPDTDATPSLEI